MMNNRSIEVHLLRMFLLGIMLFIGICMAVYFDNNIDSITISQVEQLGVFAGMMLPITLIQVVLLFKDSKGKKK